MCQNNQHRFSAFLFRLTDSRDDNLSEGFASNNGKVPSCRDAIHLFVVVVRTLSILHDFAYAAAERD